MRVVRTPDGRVVLDATGKAAGRGAYLCADGACWQAALDRNVIQRALDVPLPPDVREQLETKIRTSAPATGRAAPIEGGVIGQE